MKKITSFLLIIILLLFSVGCTLEQDTTTEPSKDKFENLFDDIEHGKRNEVYLFTEEDYNDTVAYITKMNEMQLDSMSEFALSMNLLTYQKKLFYVAEQSLIIQVYSYIFPTNEEILNEHAKVSELVIATQQGYYNFLIKISKTEVGQSSFTEEDLEFLKNMEETRDDAYYELEKENSLLEIKYLELLNTASTTEFQLAEQYVKMVNKNNQIAQKLGYNNYLEYAYQEVYQRSYSYEDLTLIKDGLKNDILPNILQMFVGFQESNNSLTLAEQYNLSKVLLGDFDDVSSNLSDLANFVGGDYLKHYNYLWNDGEYYIGNESSNAGAFVASVSTKQIAYFGPGYYNLFTVAHEFGHYAAGREDILDVNNERNLLDLAEFQSQANENLLASFMIQNNVGDNSYEVIADYNLLNSLTTIMLSVAVNDFEYQVYNKVNLQASDISEIMMDVYDSYGADSLEIYKVFYGDDASSIWSRTAAPSPGYYITYGMSVIPSIEMFFEAEENINKAKDDYILIMKAGSDLFETIETIQYHNPLTTNILSELTRKIKDRVCS